MGVPAHVTVVFPFVPRGDIDGGVLTDVRKTVESCSAFGYRLTEARWFEPDVAYVAVEPEEPFRRLTEVVWEAFPEYPPYGGAHEDPTPHVTIGYAETGDLGEAVEAVGRMLPIEARAGTVELITLEGGRWSVAEVFSLH